MRSRRPRGRLSRRAPADNPGWCRRQDRGGQAAARERGAGTGGTRSGLRSAVSRRSSFSRLASPGSQSHTIPVLAAWAWGRSPGSSRITVFPAVSAKILVSSRRRRPGPRRRRACRTPPSCAGTPSSGETIPTPGRAAGLRCTGPVAQAPGLIRPGSPAPRGHPRADQAGQLGDQAGHPVIWFGRRVDEHPGDEAAKPAEGFQHGGNRVRTGAHGRRRDTSAAPGTSWMSLITALGSLNGANTARTGNSIPCSLQLAEEAQSDIEVVDHVRDQEMRPGFPLFPWTWPARGWCQPPRCARRRRPRSGSGRARERRASRFPRSGRSGPR